MSRQRGGKNLLILLLTVGLIFCNGCSLVLLNHANRQQGGQLSEDKNPTEGVQTPDKTENGTPAPTEKPKEPSTTNGELVTDYLTSKMELLEQVINMYYMDEISVESEPGKGTLVKMQRKIGKGRELWTTQSL